MMTNRSCHHGRRRGERGVLAPLYFEIPQQKKVVFLISSGKNQIYLLLAPLDKFKKNPLMPPPGKNPSDAHGCHNSLFASMHQPVG